MSTKSLYRFLNLVDGSWRNAVYVECGNCTVPSGTCSSHLLAIDCDGSPQLYAVHQFQAETGELIEKEECVAVIPRRVFECLYSRWILWNISEVSTCTTKQLAENLCQNKNQKESEV